MLDAAGRVLRDRAPAVRGGAQIGVVKEERHAVAGDLEIGLDDVDALAQGRSEASDGVRVGVEIAAAVGANPKPAQSLDEAPIVAPRGRAERRSDRET